MLVSGGHSSLLRVEDVTTGVDPLGATIDDAAGEAFDKVARLLGLPFPGGPHIDRAAREGTASRSTSRAGSPRGRDLERHRFDFSFSGLKTAVARWVEARERAGEPVPVADVAASFQEAVCDVLTRKAIDAAVSEGIEDILIGGGVAANSRLRAMAEERAAAKRHPGAGPAARPVHRQRRDGRRARRRDGRPRPHAVPARPARRLLAAGHLALAWRLSRPRSTEPVSCQAHPGDWYSATISGSDAGRAGPSSVVEEPSSCRPAPATSSSPSGRPDARQQVRRRRSQATPETDAGRRPR